MEETNENLSNDPDENKNTEPSPPQEVTEHGEILPVTDDVPEDDAAEPEDADVGHTTSEDEVNEVQEES